MTGALVILAFTMAVGFVLWLYDRHKRRRAGAPPDPERKEPVCCGLHAVCEKKYPKAVEPGFEYFEDEELDRFRGRASDDYDDAETEEFRDVLLTLRPSEVAPWAAALQHRGINMPEIVNQEMMLILSEIHADD